MIGKTDFFQFYQQLGLNPDCSLEELKNAYRRRVAELHPDRQPAGHHDPASAASLQELTAAYNAATGFRRRYGRLPGAHHLRAAAATPRPGRREYPPELGSRSTGLRWVVLGLLLLAMLAWLLWSTLAAPEAGRQDDLGTALRFVTVSTSATQAPREGEQQLRLGMDVEAVRALEGRPIMESRERWDYGPSWIGFDHDRVSGWYSSKLRPLKVATARPRDGAGTDGSH